MQHSSSFTEQKIVVVGGTSGIGYAVAQAATSAGALVTVLGRSAAEIRDNKLRGIPADITDATALANAFRQIGHFRHLVITSGGRAGSSKFAELKQEDLHLAFGIKLFGAIQAIQAALPYLTSDGSITLTSGVLARKYGPGGSLKSTLNAAVEALGKSLAKELAPRRVNVVSPGVVDSGLWGAAGSDSRLAMMERIGTGLPVGRVGTVEEAAHVYLMAMQNGFITGSVLDVEGGALL